jgi:MoaE-MoaD fusion protein
MTIHWTIQLFAGLAERIGSPAVTVTADTGSMTVAELKSLLADRYPEHRELLRVSFVACSEQYAPDDQIIRAGEELAMLPPVSGGEDIGLQPPAGNPYGDRYVLTAEPLEPAAVTARVIAPNNGAALAFVGTTREWTDGKRTVKLEYEAYAPMALRTMKQIGDEIESRWPGTLVAIAHRIGTVEIAEASVVIAVSAPRRDACYEASRYAIERLKQIVPIWKKEIWEDGSEWKGHQLGPWDPTAPPAT